MSLDSVALDSGFDVAIAGGGIVGAACALACARRGLHVVLVERAVFGSGATAAGMGHVVLMDDSEAQFALTQYSRRLWHEMASQLPASAEYEQIGTLWIAADSEEMAAAEEKHAWYSERSIPCSLLTAAELAKVEPNLADGLSGALLVPGDVVVNSPAVARELARQAEARGARLLVGQAVRAIGNGRMVLDDGAEICARRIVNALGAEAGQLTPGLPIRKRKGHLVITDHYPGCVHHQLVELGYLKSAHSVSTDSVAFNVQPRPDGRLFIGSSRQFDSESPEVDPHMLDAMLARAALYLPAVAELSGSSGQAGFHVRAGFRAATPDKLPLIGPDPNDFSVLLATGHEGLGITTSLATAELIADWISGQSPAIAPEPYLPSRYGRASSTDLEPKG